MTNIDAKVLASEQTSQRLLWWVLAAATIGFWVDYALVVRGTSQGFDDHVMLWVHDRTTSWLTRVFTVITDTGGVGRTVPVVIVSVFFLATRRQLEAWTLVTAAIVGQGLTYLVKALVERDRPNLFYVANMPTDTSFPSGHALGSTIVYGFLAVLLWRHDLRSAALALWAWIALMSFSRVYFGVHHPTDVIASLCLGAGFLATTLLIYDRVKWGSLR